MRPLLIIAIKLMLLSMSCFAQQAEMTVNIRGLISSKGKVYIAVFAEDKGFPSDAASAKYTAIVSVQDKQALATLSLPKGVYAISVFHDENDNKTLDKNMVGYPKEKFGFSNDPKILFSAPSFKECSFEIRSGKNEITVLVN